MVLGRKLVRHSTTPREAIRSQFPMIGKLLNRLPAPALEGPPRKPLEEGIRLDNGEEDIIRENPLLMVLMPRCRPEETFGKRSWRSASAGEEAMETNKSDATNITEEKETIFEFIFTKN